LQKEIETKGRLLQKLLEESFLVNTLLESSLVTRVIQKHMPSRYRREAKSNLYINRTLWYFISVCGVWCTNIILQVFFDIILLNVA